MKISEMQMQAHSTAITKGWWDNERNILELLMLVVTEAAEAAEAVRNGLPLTTVEHPSHSLGSELADIIIRVADMAAHLNINLEHEVVIKMEYNKTRPTRHGGKLA